ncbi:MFS transporter [Oceanicola sp. 22II-s10i]|uniref:c-type cytochrome n=1 Tax=Oceanicola sp. 22II-s10i TaxID=1317116 RepID=UPI000B64FDD2|nr:c-type cytochrome [Oceanicola sp. 22II-s10i]OWU83516.1 MFS transporter [Oceanicola sp. 22II-s10i]
MAADTGPAETPAAPEGGYGIGRAALPEEVAAWNIDVSPDGTGLPVGSGSVEDGERIFSENCAACHGEFAEGAGNWPKLAGGDGSLADEDPLKTVGSYWPYLSTTFDYVHRSMPFGAAQTMSVDDTYAIVAYILYSNYIVEDDFVLSNENFLDVEMPNADGFIVDDRPETEYAKWRVEPCMVDCKPSVEITKRATVLDVTPEETAAKDVAAGGGASSQDEAKVEPVSAETPSAEAPKAEESAKAETASADPELVAAGEKVFGKCKACHEVGAGAKNKTGPELNGVIGRVMGSIDGFKYSKGFQQAHDEGRVWDEAAMAEFMANPKAFMKGTRMSFVGLKKDEDVAALIAYLSTIPE